MKIAQLGPAHPFRGGIVHFNSRLAEALRIRPDLDMALYYWSKPYPVSLLPKSVKNRQDKHSTMTFHQPGLNILSYTNPLSWLMLVLLVKKGRYDMFITHWVHPVHFPVFSIIFMAIRLLTRTQICLIVHNFLPHEHLPGAKIMTRSIVNMAHKVILHGSSETQKARSCNISHRNIHKAFHPVYDQFILPVESRESIRTDLGLRSKVFLFFGFIRPYKGLGCLLEAFRRIAPTHQDMSLLVVGEYFYPKAKMEPGVTVSYPGKAPGPLGLSLADPIHRQVVWINRYVPNEEVGRYFSVADVVVVPYHEASQSGPLQIAYAFDKPVIASDIPAFREIVSDGESGYLFRPGDPTDLANKMNFFFQRSIQPAQVNAYRQRFNWDDYSRILVGSRDSTPPPCNELFSDRN